MDLGFCFDADRQQQQHHQDDQFTRPQTFFRTLRQLHAQNLENQGLNDLSEAFQNFVTRAKFYSIGRLRRTWSHSAVEFMKYRRRLPAIMADSVNATDAVDVFDDVDLSTLSNVGNSGKKYDDRKIVVTNVSHRVTATQLASFFTKFGRVSSCHIPLDGNRNSMYSTMPKNVRSKGTAHITFKYAESAIRAKQSSDDELTFYGKVMVVTAYTVKSKSNRQHNQTLSVDMYGSVTGSISIVSDTADDDRSSIASSELSQANIDVAESPSYSYASTIDNSINFNDLPEKVIQLIFSRLSPIDRIRIERVCKKWLEFSFKSWTTMTSLAFSNSRKALRNSSLRSILSRCGMHLRRLDLSSIEHLFDEKVFEIIAKYCPNLRQLDITGINASWQTLRQFATNLPLLTSISYRDQRTLNEKAFSYLFRGCQNLRHVDLRGCRRLHGRCFRLLGLFLEEVLLDGCKRLEPEAIDEICLKSINVRELRLNECYRLTDNSIGVISRSLGDLEVITLCGDSYVHLSTAGLMPLTRLSRLREIRFDNNPLMSNELLEAFAVGTPRLRSISIARAGRDSILNESGLLSLARFEQLNELDVSYLTGITSRVILSIIDKCSRLQILKLHSCTCLNDDTIMQLASLSLIEEIDLSGCLRVTNRSIQTLLNAFANVIKVRSIDDQLMQKNHPVTIVIGGTHCDAHKLRMKGSRVVLDTSDYSTFSPSVRKYPAVDDVAIASDDDDGNDDSSEDEFESLAAQRSYMIDTLVDDDDDDLSNEQWIEDEARALGLITTSSTTTSKQ